MQRKFLYPIIFAIGGMFGWLIDTTYRSWLVGYYAPGTLVPFFSIIFGIGAVILYLFFSSANISFLWSVIGGVAMCIALELASGILSLALLDYRFWDYSANPFNFYGLIDLRHGFYWLVLTTNYRLFYEYVTTSRK
ncbi:MAG: hypothetical protein G01um101413_343 [Parcubacteria group bacterium Gr01-1014_13]|nr:MAG: hypothetical protein G01um101413_343 [Parcubacteria group bacterium Gr01-1014_13]